MNIDPNITSEMSDLARAFNDARLVVLHVDMQECFYYVVEHNSLDHQTDYAFHIVSMFAQNIRSLGIANHWIAYSEKWGQETVAQYNKWALENALEFELQEQIDALDGEVLFNKAQPSAFRSEYCALSSYLEIEGVNTLIVDGVKAYHCLTDTVADALDKGFRVYIPVDATNCLEKNRSNFIDWFMKGTNEKQKSQITFTTTGEILSTLRQAQANQQQLPVRTFAHG